MQRDTERKIVINLYMMSPAGGFLWLESVF